MAFKLLNKKEDVEETIDEIKKSIDLPELPKEFKKESKQSEVYQVVDQLPVQEIRTFVRKEDGVIVKFITKEEATDMLNVRV